MCAALCDPTMLPFAFVLFWLLGSILLAGKEARSDQNSNLFQTARAVWSLLSRTTLRELAKLELWQSRRPPSLAHFGVNGFCAET